MSDDRREALLVDALEIIATAQKMSEWDAQSAIGVKVQYIAHLALKRYRAALAAEPPALDVERLVTAMNVLGWVFEDKDGLAVEAEYARLVREGDTVTEDYTDVGTWSVGDIA